MGACAVRTCKDCKSELPLDAKHFQRRTRFNRDGKQLIVFDHRCKSCQIFRNKSLRYSPTGNTHGKQMPHKLTGWVDPIDKLFFCGIKP